MLISAATLTRLNGGAKLYGTLFITDVEDSGAELQSLGTNTVYGSVIVDGTLGSYQGTFQVVWNDNTSRKAGAGGGIGSVLGGWSGWLSRAAALRPRQADRPTPDQRLPRRPWLAPRSVPRRRWLKARALGPVRRPPMARARSSRASSPLAKRPRKAWLVCLAGRR